MAFQRQLLGTFSSALTVISCGACVGYSAVLLPQLKDESEIGNITNSVDAWIGSIISVSAIVGNLTAVPLTERFGRTTLQQILAIPMTIGWILIAVANSVPLILIGRLLTGLAMGLNAPIASMYVGELSSPKYRSFLLAFISLGVYSGTSLSHLLGTFFNWRSVAYILSTLSLVSAILFFYIPDTPSWMVSRDMFEEARTSFKWYREAEETEEIEIMIELKISECLACERKSKCHNGLFGNVKNLMDNIKRVEFVKPLVIIILLIVMMQFCGALALSAYGIQIMNAMFKGDYNAYTVILALDGIKVLVAVLACFALKYVKRRTALNISSFLAFSSLFAIAGFIYLKESDLISINSNWFSFLLLSIYMGSISLGIVPLPWSLMGELFPLKTKSLGASISSVFNTFMLFLSTLTTPDMFENIGLAGSFLLYGLVIFVITIILLFILPETKNKTLQEIEDGFKSKKSKYFTLLREYGNTTVVL